MFSPNAHYDFEALLPALPDTVGVYDDTDLVSTADFLTGSDPTGASPLRLGFTVGCHAGLNVSDVQVGPTLDWAQLYSQSQTQWVAHTTYGYGDTEIVAYSERLATLFAGNVAAMTGEEPARRPPWGRGARRQAALPRQHPRDDPVRREDPAVVDVLRPADVLHRRAAATPARSDGRDHH